MPQTSPRPPDYRRELYSFGGVERAVLKTGDKGPAVIVLHEVYGFTDTLARFCRWIARADFRVYTPILFGRPDLSNKEAQSLGRVLGLCVSREIYVFARGRSSPVVEWLKPLARQAHAERGGVGVVGMCVTGEFALAMAVEPAVLAPVLAQPASPTGAPAAIDIRRTELGVVRQRADREGLQVRGYRFEGDALCRAARFETLRRALGDAFVGRTLADASANPASPMARAGQPPHSVFTGDLVDAPDNPTRQAVGEVIGFFRTRLARV